MNEVKDIFTEQLEAQNKRYRDALAQIEDLQGGYEYVARDAIKIARAALKDKE